MVQHFTPGDSPGTTHRAGKFRPRHAAPQEPGANKNKRWKLLPILAAGPLLVGTVAMASPVAHSIHYHVASPVTVQALGLDNQNPAVGQTVRAGAKIVAEHKQKFDAVVFAVRDDAGHHADFPVTKNWKQGTHQRTYQASRAFNAAGTYTYWFAYEKDGHWTDLAPKQKFTVRQQGGGGGTATPAPSDPASPSPSPSGSTTAPALPGSPAATSGSSTPTSSAPTSSAPTSSAPTSSAPAPSPSKAAGTSSSAPAPRPAPSTATSTTAAPSPAGPTASPSPSPSTSGATSGSNQSAYVTFYAARDNDPAGSTAIAYPGMHQQAGGTGTFSDPITFATSKSELAPGTKIYVPKLHKYFVMEDDCAECDSDWSQQKWHVDLYMGGSTQPGVVTCENQMTQDGDIPIVINPDANRPVDAHALYSDSTGCYTTTY